MDKLKTKTSCMPEQDNVIPFVPEVHPVAITVKGMTFYRKQYPLHPAQGMLL
jgi:hypothetical protein